MNIIPISQIIDGYSRCFCGAITFYSKDGKSVSCKENNLYKYFPETFVNGISLDVPPKNIKEYEETVCCDHCANHYGLDLCACGSGEHYSECKNGFDACGTPRQSINDFLF